MEFEVTITMRVRRLIMDETGATILAMPESFSHEASGRADSEAAAYQEALAAGLGKFIDEHFAIRGQGAIAAPGVAIPQGSAGGVLSFGTPQASDPDRAPEKPIGPIARAKRKDPRRG